MQLHHVTIPVRGRRALARDEAERRALVRTLVRVAGPSLLLFGLGDDHLHEVTRSDRPRVVTSAVRRALHALRPDLVFKPPSIEPVDNRSYLLQLVGYILAQPDHHGLGVHSALWSGSSFQELVGARVIPGFDPRAIFQELPRLLVRDVFARLHLEQVPLRPATDDALARAGPARLAELAAFVHCVGPDLTVRDRTPEYVDARALCVHIGRQLGLATQDLARAIGRDPRQVQHLAARPVEPRAVLAVRLRLALEERVAQEALAAQLAAARRRTSAAPQVTSG